MKKIAIIINAKSDLSQCTRGLRHLKASSLEVEVIGVYVRSQHRNIPEVQKLLLKLLGDDVDVIIIGASGANHLASYCDAYLRYTLRTTKMPVIGVVFDEAGNNRHTEASILSITEVPGTQVIFKDIHNRNLIGNDGFLNACKMVTSNQTLSVIKLPMPRVPLDFSLGAALDTASTLL